jgi:hypothetical protein
VSRGAGPRGAPRREAVHAPAVTMSTSHDCRVAVAPLHAHDAAASRTAGLHASRPPRASRPAVGRPWRRLPPWPWRRPGRRSESRRRRDMRAPRQAPAVARIRVDDFQRHAVVRIAQRPVRRRLPGLVIEGDPKSAAAPVARLCLRARGRARASAGDSRGRGGAPRDRGPSLARPRRSHRTPPRRARAPSSTVTAARDQPGGDGRPRSDP